MKLSTIYREAAKIVADENYCDASEPTIDNYSGTRTEHYCACGAIQMAVNRLLTKYGYEQRLAAHTFSNLVDCMQLEATDQFALCVKPACFNESDFWFGNTFDESNRDKRVMALLLSANMIGNRTMTIRDGGDIVSFNY